MLSAQPIFSHLFIRFANAIITMKSTMFLFHTQLRLGVLLFMTSLLFACSHTPQRNQLAQQPFSPRQVELTDVPFFPQTEYQCGPAALATVMQYRGIAIEPEA